MMYELLIDLFRLRSSLYDTLCFPTSSSVVLRDQCQCPQFAYRAQDDLDIA